MKTLDDSQLAAFDVEFVDDRLWSLVAARIDCDFPAGDFRFLDVGGGTGRFADQLLERYPRATGTVLDSSERLLAGNRPHDRKTLINDSVERLAELFAPGEFDLICFHWLLHHLVFSSWSGSRLAMVKALGAARELLSERGRVSLFENMYDGLLIDGMPGFLIFTLTSSKLLSPLLKGLGANTAGVGVCFQSRRQWKQLLTRAGCTIKGYSDDVTWTLPWHWRVLLHMGYVRVGHFWCLRDRGAATGTDLNILPRGG